MYNHIFLSVCQGFKKDFVAFVKQENKILYLTLNRCHCFVTARKVQGKSFTVITSLITLIQNLTITKKNW